MEKQINPQIANRLKNASQFLGAFVFFIGFFALVGWQFDWVLFKNIFPGLPTIAPNTAFALFLSGLVLFLDARGVTDKKEYIRHLGYIFSAVIFFLGLATLVEYLFGASFGVDRILFAASQGGSVRMSPQSAFNFLMLGLSLFFVLGKSKEAVREGQAVILITGVVSLISLFGFIYNITSFYTLASFKGMAAHTAAAFVMMFFGVLLSHPDVGFVRIFSSRNPSGITARRLFGTLMFVLAMEVFIAVGNRQGFFGADTDALFQLIVIGGSFVYLIFFAFRSLDELGKMEKNLARSRELDQAKTEFVGLASHQLRTPLTAVSWYTEMLLGKDFGKLNPKQEEYLKEIYAGNRRMIDLVDDLLNTSRIDMGTLKVKLENVDLTKTMDITLDELAPQTEKKNLSIRKKYGENLPELKLDPELLGIVFQNIVSNAVKYTPARGSISVGIKKINSHIQVKIADNGWGIPKNQQKKIFTKLFRADNVRKMDTEGTGLGLYIARAIVKKFKGKLWFESKEGEGTTFYITFKP
ncbi:MAG: HAMP domain-containing sensor histidine kinase [Candidatus Moranbacteria bacterium]|nr:HAMP domain-containing sensor histidine kinase [Candidatus Moranbacteria bacterium]